MKFTHRFLGTFALLTALASTAAANDSKEGTSGPLCGKIVPVEGHNELEAATQCSCSGGQSLQITGVGSYTAKPGSLVCESVTIYPSYDSFEPGGPTLAAPHKFVNETRIDRTCDTSDCWSFLFLGGGTAECQSKTITLPGGHMSYKAIGSCEESPKPSLGDHGEF